MVAQSQRLKSSKILKSRTHGSMVQNPTLSNYFAFFYLFWQKTTLYWKYFIVKFCF